MIRCEPLEERPGFASSPARFTSARAPPRPPPGRC